MKNGGTNKEFLKKIRDSIENITHLSENQNIKKPEVKVTPTKEIKKEEKKEETQKANSTGKSEMRQQFEKAGFDLDLDDD